MTISKVQRGQDGVTLVGVLVALGVFGVVLMVGMTLAGRMTNQQRSVQFVNRFHVIQQNVLAFIKNPDAWQATIDNNGAATACLRDSATTACTPTTSYTMIDIYYPDGTPYYRPKTDATAGFRRQPNLTGSDPDVCTGFGDGTGAAHAAGGDSHGGAINRGCPIRLEVFWRPLCDTAATCKSPKVEVIGSFVWSSGLQRSVQYNPERYGFKFVRGGDNRYHKFVVGDRRVVPGEAGGAAPSSPQYRVLNYEFVDTGDDVQIHPSSGSGTNTADNTEIKVQPGVWECEISAPAFRVGGHKVHLIKKVGASEETLVEGASAYSDRAINSRYQTRSMSKGGRFSLNEPAILRLKHFIEAPETVGNELGYPVPATFGAGENVYSIVKCVKDM